jgi:hypothetical protein
MQVIHKSASLINPTFDRTPASMITGNILLHSTSCAHGHILEPLSDHVLHRF